MNKRILLLGDSLGMPTGKNEITYEDTYPYILSKGMKDFEVVSRHRRTNDTTQQLKYQFIFDDVEMMNPDYMVIHLGIVDCSPRLFSRFQNAAIRKLPNSLSKSIIKVFSKYRYFITKTFPKVYVSKQQYEINLNKFIQLSVEFNITPIFIEILQTSKDNNKKSFNFQKNINQYNEILKRITQENKINIIKYKIPNTYLLDDGIHITKEANLYIAEQIQIMIENDLC